MRKYSMLVNFLVQTLQSTENLILYFSPHEKTTLKSRILQQNCKKKFGTALSAQSAQKQQSISFYSTWDI